jgi:hypothetical protein
MLVNVSNCVDRRTGQAEELRDPSDDDHATRRQCVKDFGDRVTAAALIRAKRRELLRSQAAIY